MITCTVGCAGKSGILAEEWNGSTTTFKIPTTLFTENFYRAAELKFTVQGLQTSSTFGTPMKFTIETYYTDSNGANWWIDKYENIEVAMNQATQSFGVKSSATKVGENGNIVVTWQTEEIMYLYADTSFITLQVPKANVFYRNELDTLRASCLG